MIYPIHVTFPRNQTSNTKTFRRFHANRGIIYRLWIQFPPGCNGLVKVGIAKEGHPLIQSRENEFLNGDGYTFEFPLMEEIEASPEQITISGWNEDDTYDHTIQFIFLVVDRKYVMPVGAAEGIIAGMRSLFPRRKI